MTTPTGYDGTPPGTYADPEEECPAWARGLCAGDCHANPSPHHRGGGKALDTTEVGVGAGSSSASPSMWFYRAWMLTWVTPMLVWVLS